MKSTNLHGFKKHTLKKSFPTPMLPPTWQPNPSVADSDRRNQKIYGNPNPPDYPD